MLVLILNGLLTGSALLFADAADLFHAQGELAGEPTTTSVLLQTRLTATPGLDDSGDVPGSYGQVRFEWSRDAALTDPQVTPWRDAVPKDDFIVRVRLSGLSPGTTYYYRVRFGPSSDDTRPGPVRSFRTLPGGSSEQTVRFCMGSCMNYFSFMQGRSNGGGPISATDDDRRLGYPSFAAMAALQPDFFVGTGDIVYYDHPRKEAAEELPELRRKWHEQFRFLRLVEFFGQTPAYWSKDDHDFRFNDADRSGNREPPALTGIQLFREQMPIHEQHDQESPTYRTHRVNRWLQIWLTEGRDYRSDNRDPDGPQKTLWGDRQREWLQSTLADSDAVWKVIISPTPMVGPDDARKRDNHANLNGFRHEAQRFFQWRNDHQVDNVFVFCGDRHWQYHSIHPSGIEEFGCGALNDENSRRGVAPGSPRGTDPEGLIRQPWTYAEPTGGFLYVTCGPNENDVPEFTVQFRDDTGAVLHTHRRTAER